ncbi:negative cofactor 2 transcription regulator complex subunit ncb2 [Lithohypha guttulata]|uniref:NCT transcriptional regulatory complex subunit B n=1 Tax=Lithohypha guttulata TaxID=1690604 RepID=A0AAN7SUJ2_9EURO|nr:negative cofactor 2 transcription regulator complex subunit ncb2 [Lithohypha guttulata]KAK5081957.1 negative cofactor 2 transcription regulator complex subunit ncb2 [Lithohypha guttulata]KAK5105587.1 negative cofactor 2 transcription regulator complex subunit ncb2 [Lithohypha guttulata]
MSDKELGGGNEELSLPKATVQKIISEILPQLPPEVSLGNDMTFTKGARDMLIQCSMEFLRMLSSEANDVSEKESKKTIAVEHVEAALKDLGFGDYIGGIRGVVGEWKEVQTKRVNRGERMKNWGGLNVSEEELEKMQAALFGEAKEKMEGHDTQNTN